MQIFSNRSVAAVVLFGTLVGTTISPAQSTHAAPSARPGLEFPVVMRQNVEAGKTPVGTKIQVRLMVGTLVNGIVVPEGADLSGVVVESSFKTATDPSRLAICLQSAEWKNGSTPAALALPSKIYLTAWYYPLVTPPQDFPDGLPDATHSGPQRRGGTASYPSTNDSPSSTRANAEKDRNPPLPSRTVTPHREMMKDVQSAKTGAGGVVIVSARANIKLDKSTTYVFAEGDLGADSRIP